MVDCKFTRESSWKVYVLMFVFYSVLGSIGEHIFYWIGNKFGNPLAKTKTGGNGMKRKTIFNPIMDGFPLYGITAYAMIFIKRIIDDYSCKSGSKINIVIEFFIFALVALMIEYAAGTAVGAGPNSKDENGYVKAWDFSMNHYNYKGIVDIWHTLAYATIGLIVVRVHPIIVAKANKMFE